MLSISRVTEQSSREDFQLKYVPSLELLADGLTKPLGTRQLKAWRKRIIDLNHVDKLRVTIADSKKHCTSMMQYIERSRRTLPTDGRKNI